jgi:hypothetical protein
LADPCARRFHAHGHRIPFDHGAAVTIVDEPLPAHAVFDKTAWLREREIEEAWPVAGLPENIHVDNGADFRSRAFERACRDEGVKIIWRPRREPHFGGHIERLIGTQMGPIHLLPGSTSSNIQERREYDSKRHAALTLRELERYIALEIAGQYHPFNIAATAARGLARARILDKASSAAGSNEVLDLLLAGGRAHASP